MSRLFEGIIHLCRVEQAYINAYEGEGWKGANREKVRPTGELKQAHLQVGASSFVFVASCQANTTHGICSLSTQRALYNGSSNAARDMLLQAPELLQLACYSSTCDAQRCLCRLRSAS